MRRKFNPLLTRGVIICAVVALVLCAWSSVFSMTGATDPLRVAAVTVSSPLTTLLDRMGGGVARGFAAAFGRDHQYNEWMTERAALEAALAERNEQLAELQSLREQNKQLRDYLALTEQNTSLVLTEAHRLYTSDTTARVLTLDRGSRHGIKVGMPVLSADGLIGRVSEVLPFCCKVATLYDEKIAVGVKDARSGVNGTLSAMSGADGLCRISGMDANIDRFTALAVGDVIVTSGYGGNFPADIVVGVITESGVDPLDRTPYAIVAPYADVTDPTALLMIVTDILTETVTPTPIDPTPEDTSPTDDPTRPDEGDQPPIGPTDPPAPEEPSAGENLPTDPAEPGAPDAPIDPEKPDATESDPDGEEVAS